MSLRLPHPSTWQPLARGGMSEVYRTWATSDDGTTRPVAVKRLLKSHADDPRATELFVTEAELSLMLRHTNIVAGLMRGRMGGRPCMVMEYVDGPDVARLSARARRTQLRLAPSASVSIGVQALRGLHHAHEACAPSGRHLGLVHRDVSPENLFCTRQGEVKVADFGIAKLISFSAFTDPVFGVRGKQSFMAPERAIGDVFDGRSDAFSVALVVYELLSGFRPYAPLPEESAVSLTERIIEARIPPLHRLMPSVPRRLSDVIMKALARKPQDRFASCGEFADVLQGTALGLQLPVGPGAVREWVEELFPTERRAPAHDAREAG